MSAKASWSRRRTTVVLALVAMLALATAGFAKKRMQSTKLGPMLCETTYGGKFVDLPGFPGEKLDRRLLADVRYLERKYKIFVTDGYAMSGHAMNGEHPLGLALDIVPNKAEGGRWSHIDRLAQWAEPRPDRPRAPFRWVGYDGDEGHGRGHHLHLSWSHTEIMNDPPATEIYTLRCPSDDPRKPPPEPQPPTGGGGGGGAGGEDDSESGGTIGGLIGGSGGLPGKLGLAPVVPEAGGVDLGE